MFRFSRKLLAQRYLTAMRFLRRFFSFSLRRKTSGARPDPLQPVRNAAARRAIWARPTLHHQQQSAFFTKLPPEIRHRVYREVLAPADRPELHETCGAGGWNHACWWANCLLRGGTTAPNPSTGRYEAEDESPYATRMGLLRSCRHMYSESNPVLCFRQTRTIVDLQRTVLPQRWRDIRSLHLTVPLELYLNNNGL
ncbi:uncharacterized protein KD926_002377 [Aspergillus affinis]|uniref:uncharacterized protein n=1 Tax=Aspergillus affinis TaxID=1070780 RepID=UPI0022FEDFFD|nr:uncharacterized protein KD926_002377 [Aspergillus affinis]KAI9043998.1 hypothetical protein KD926_002377 [Aspergillus affinis]